MKSTTFLLVILMFSFAYSGIAQTKMHLGAGYFGDGRSKQGGVLEYEYEKYFSEQFSLPLRADLGFFVNPDYRVLFFDIHKGFRKYFDSGLYLEQSIGIGITSSFYTLESIWYEDEYQGMFRYKEGANWGFAPSITLGAGYQFSKNKEKQHSIWLRPKIYWNLGVRGLHLPYAALQVGYTYHINTK